VSDRTVNCEHLDLPKDHRFKAVFRTDRHLTPATLSGGRVTH
jgi:hypothetical protein